MGTYSPTEIPNYVFDNNTATKYLNFGSCNSSQPISLACGINSGLYVTPQRGSSSLVNIQFCTANDVASRDPLTVTIEGSNQPSSSLTLGSSWTPIYNGSTGLQPIMTRNACGSTLFVSNNSNWYASYRVLVTSIRSPDVATQYSELRMMGYQWFCTLMKKRWWEELKLSNGCSIEPTIRLLGLLQNKNNYTKHLMKH